MSGAHVSAVDPVAVAAQLRALLAEIDGPDGGHREHPSDKRRRLTPTP